MNRWSFTFSDSVLHPGVIRICVNSFGTSKDRTRIISGGERNKANRELLEKLADYFGTSKDRTRIISGTKSTKN